MGKCPNQRSECNHKTLPIAQLKKKKPYETRVAESPYSDSVLTCVLGDPLTSGQLRYSVLP